MSGITRVTGWPWWGAWLSVLACADLPAVASGVCGNAIQESENDEECDTYAADGQACRPPGAPGECRYDCSPRAQGTPSCPSGAACGVDGICRFSQLPREYAPWGDFVPMPARSLKVGDFDGDGRQDLLALGNPNPLWQSLPRVLFFDSAGTPRDVFDPQTPVSSPVVADLDPLEDAADRRQQVVLGAFFGIATLQATRERAVLPIAYPFQVLPEGWSYRVLPVRGTATVPLHKGVLVLWGQADQTWVIVPDLGTEVAGLAKPLPALAGEPIPANVIDGADSPCEEALLAFHGDANLYLLDTCDAQGQWRQAYQPSAVARLGEGHTVEQGVLAALVNEDAHLDLLLGDEQGMPHVAFGRGDGSFVADPMHPDTTLGAAWPVSVIRGNCLDSVPVDPRFPLAVGDLNADGSSDWVSPGGVLLTQRVTVEASRGQVMVEACPANGPFVRQWSSAKIADLNHDGQPDVIAGSASEPTLDFLVGKGQDRLNRFGIDTEGPVTHLVIGDFDGDVTLDVAFAEQTTEANGAAGTSWEKLAIAFGTAFGVPSEPVDVAHFAAIKQLTSAPYGNNDAVDELGVISEPGGGSGEELAVFVGNPGRHPIAPLGLASRTPQGLAYSGTPLGSAVGSFRLGARPGVMAVARDDCRAAECPLRLWLVPGTGHGNLGDPLPSETLPPSVGGWLNDELALSVFTGDVNRDGVDEAFLLTAHESPSTLALWQVDLPPPETAWLGQDPVHLVSTGPGRITAASTPKLVDVDRDQALDLVLIRLDDGGQERLEVVWNSVDHDTPFDLSSGSPVEVGDEPPRAFATVVDPVTTRFLGITEAATYEIPTGRARQAPLVGTPVPGLPGGRAVALGDLTGDGLLDPVIAVSGGVRIWGEVPKRP